MPTVGYWDCRGLCEPIRLILVQAGVEFEDKRYKSKEEWAEDKFSLGFEFPNMPYLIDDEGKFTQSLAIMRYLARKHDMGGNNENEQRQLDLLEQVAIELLQTCGRTWFNSEALKDPAKALSDSLVPKLQQMAKFIGDKKFVLGDRVSYVDMILYSVLDYIRLFIPDFIARESALPSFLERIETLPNIKKYINSDKFSRMPVTGPTALWGNKKE